MRKLTEELQQHIHGDLCLEVNDFIIRMKIEKAWRDSDPLDWENRKKLLEARTRHPEPTLLEIIELLSKVRDEMNDCKIPFRRKDKTYYIPVDGKTIRVRAPKKPDKETTEALVAMARATYEMMAKHFPDRNKQ